VSWLHAVLAHLLQSTPWQDEGDADYQPALSHRAPQAELQPGRYKESSCHGEAVAMVKVVVIEKVVTTVKVVAMVKTSATVMAKQLPYGKTTEQQQNHTTQHFCLTAYVCIPHKLDKLYLCICTRVPRTKQNTAAYVYVYTLVPGTMYIHIYMAFLSQQSLLPAVVWLNLRSSLQHLSASCSSCSAEWGRAEELSWGLPGAPSLYCMLEPGRLCRWHPSQPSGKERK